MILNDFTVPKSKYSNEQLDAVLVELCEIVLEGKQDNPDFYGMVAAAVIDPKGRLVTGLNYLYGSYRVHAERAAIDKYEEEYGELPKGSIVVTTLSPCSDRMDSRYEESCADLLNSKGVKLAYCGYRDPSQENTQDKFVTIITENNKIKNLCSKFAHTFLDKGITENNLNELSNNLPELINKTDNVDGIQVSINTNSKNASVYATSHGRRLGYVEFDRDGNILVPYDLAVSDEYRGQGIAAVMYDYVKSLGFTIKASPEQTDAGKYFWKKNRGSKRVWESTEPTQAQQFIDSVYSQYPDWPYGQADKVMVWGEGEDQQFAAFKLKPGTAPDTVEIDWIMAGPEQRKGVGSRAIKELQRQAQAAGIKLTLFPWAKGQISQASLTKLYKRHGFKPVAKGAKPMRWEPQLDEDFNQCYDVACKLYDKAESENLNPLLLQVAGYKGDGSTANTRWLEIPPRLWQHYVTVVGDMVLDPTAKQFGSDKATKYSRSQLEHDWDKQYQIKPKELNELKIDNVNGLGSVPWNQEVDYMGLRVLMKPSTFLQLSLPLNMNDDDKKTIQHLEKEKDTIGFGAPFLQVDMERSIPRITGHDGRHRMIAIQATEGDHPVEVHIFPKGMRNKDMTPEVVSKLNDLVVSQNGKYVPGPIFTREVSEQVIWEDEHDPEVDEWLNEDLRQQLLTQPHLFENDDRYTSLKDFLNSHDNVSPKIGKSYSIATIKSIPIGHTISIAKTNNNKLLLDIDPSNYIFNFGHKKRSIPRSKFNQGDLLSYTLLFNSVNDLEHFIVLLKLKYSDWKHSTKDLLENFADGKGPGRPGDSQRHGIPKGATIAQLEKASHVKGRKGQLARWQLNMRRGHKK